MERIPKKYQHKVRLLQADLICLLAICMLSCLNLSFIRCKWIFFSKSQVIPQVFNKLCVSSSEAIQAKCYQPNNGSILTHYGFMWAAIFLFFYLGLNFFSTLLINLYRKTGFLDNSKGVLVMAGYYEALRTKQQLLMNVPDSIHRTVRESAVCCKYIYIHS